jgi:hypothetical protein
MIAPFRFLWKQLNGPQITAICTAIFRYLKRQLDTTLDYLNTFSVDTANDDHLSLIGMIAGLVRPIVDFSPSTMFWFTDHGPLHNSEHGLADLEERGIGGRFSDLNDPATTSVHELLPAHYYRKLLKVWTDSDFDGTSLAFLDTVLDIIWKDMRHTDSAYVINIRDSVATIENRSYGDVEIDLGNAADWEDRITYVRGMLEGIATTLYNPIPRIFPDFDDEE